MASTAAEREGEEGQRDGAGAGSRSTNGIMRTSSGWDGKLRVNKTAKLVIDADTEAMMKQAGAAHAASGAGAGSDSDDDNASEGDKGDSDDGARAKVRSEGKEPLTRAEDDEGKQPLMSHSILVLFCYMFQ